MLSHQDNETLVRVGPGTTMGGMMRLYWIPFYAAADLEKDGQPQTVKLLGETLVVFRDSEGNVGLVDHVCPHRGAPMSFARNEDCGLRCVYHGWKFDVGGNVTDMPAGVANKGSDLLEDDVFIAREHFWPLEHAEMGTLKYNGPAYRFEKTPSELRFASPRLGEHTDQVMTEILGFDDAAVARFREEGILQ